MRFSQEIYTRARELSLAFGPTGCEKRVLELVEKELKDVCECSYDKIGDLVCRLPGKKEKLAILCGVDETGFMITKIDDRGYLRFEPTGDADPSCFLGKKMLAGNEETLLEGVGGGKVLHLTSGGERTDAPGFEKLFIDLGFEKKEELEGKLERGDFAAYKGEFFELPDDYVVGKALECRLNCAILVELMKQAAEQPESKRKDLYAVFAVKEKIGFSGAVTALHRIAPARAVVLGFEPSRDLDEKDAHKKGAVPGEGPVLALKDGRALFYDSEFFEEARALPVQKQILDGSVSLSSSRAHLAREGVPMISLRLPCHNPETPLVIVKKQDAENMLRMLCALAAGAEE